MAGVGERAPWSAVRGFALGLALFVVGGLLLGLSFLVYALGSVNGDLPGTLGILFMAIGLILAIGRHGAGEIGSGGTPEAEEGTGTRGPAEDGVTSP